MLRFRAWAKACPIVHGRAAAPRQTLGVARAASSQVRLASSPSKEAQAAAAAPAPPAPPAPPPASADEASEYRANPLGIQMLSYNLHVQVFPAAAAASARAPPTAAPIPSQSSRPFQHYDAFESDDAAPANATPDASRLAETHLKTHGLFGRTLDALPEIQLPLPPLEHDRPIEEHFYALAAEQSEPYLSQARSFASPSLGALPPKPSHWAKASGWVRYDLADAAATAKGGHTHTWTRIDHPPDGEALVFDVEVMYKITQYPILAVAASTSAWYSWCSSMLFESGQDHEQQQQPLKSKQPRSKTKPVAHEPRASWELIPMGNPEIPRLIVGHNVAYDRARIREEYSAKPTRNAFIDTMTQQGATDPDLADDMSHELDALESDESGGSRFTTMPSADLAEGDRWKPLTALRSLKDIAKLYLGIDMDKTTRDWFAGPNLMPFDDPSTFQMLMGYCANDVHITHGVYQKLWPQFEEKCPHPVSFVGMLQMIKPYLSVSQDWQEYIDRCEALCDSFQQQIGTELRTLADKALDMLADKSYESDPWLQHLDWEIKQVRMTKPKLSASGKVLVPARPFKSSAAASPMDGKPKWYRDLWDLSDQCLRITTTKRVAPYLLRLLWNKCPVSYCAAYGWMWRKPKQESATNPVGSKSTESDSSPDGKAAANQTAKLVFSTDPADNNYSPIASFDTEHDYFRIPHPDGESANCGNPLAKSYMASFDSGTLTSEFPAAQRILSLNAQCTYWISARARVKDQFVVWDGADGGRSLDYEARPEDGAARESGSVHGPASSKMGVILPRSIPMGTVTRRAVEPTWMTAANAKATRIGSELKTLVRAPKGYSFVGADVDSEELWIASVMGDAQFGMHGSTAIGFMTLQGTKSGGTDLHSVTGKILGISRDKSKVFNYGRIYGAGLKYAIQLLLQSNPDMPRVEAQQKAEALYAKTKGTRFRSRKYGRSPLHLMWHGGTESVMFNTLDWIATSSDPRTPVLGCQIPDSLMPDNVQRQFITSRINWVVQSSGVDYLHLLLVSMDYLMRRLGIDGRFLLSIHDELRYMVKDEHTDLACLALQISNLWVRSMFASRLGLDDLPLNVAFFSLVDVDHCLRKEVDMACITPSNHTAIPPGKSFTIAQTIERLVGRLTSSSNSSSGSKDVDAIAQLYGNRELPSVAETVKRLSASGHQIPPLTFKKPSADLLQAQICLDPASLRAIESKLVAPSPKSPPATKKAGKPSKAAPTKATTTNAIDGTAAQAPAKKRSAALQPATFTTVRQRKQPVPAKLAAIHLSLSGSEPAAGSADSLSSLGSSKELASFLGDVNASLLAVSFDPKTGAVRCSKDVDALSDESLRTVVLSKTKPAVVTAANMMDIVQVTPLKSTPLNTLYQAIHGVYAPVLLKAGLNSRLQGLLSDLDTGLASAIRNAIDAKSQEGAASSLAPITTIDGEIMFWTEQAGEQGRTKADRDRGAYFRDALQPIKADFDKQGAQPLSTLLETIERIHDVLDDIWRQNEHAVYQKPRMVHLLDIISEQLLGIIQEKLGAQNVMVEPLGQIKDDLATAVDILDRWTDILRTLTATYWPLYAPNRWEGEPFTSPVIAMLGDRLRKILSLRASHESLLSLLQTDEHKELRVDEALEAFAGFCPLQCNKSTELAWSSAVIQYNRAIERVETLCAEKLQRIFGSLQTQPAQLLREFQRYRDLVQREAIARHLASERETLLGQLVAVLKSIRNEHRERMHESAALKGRNLPVVVSNIIWTRQALTKIEETDQTVASLIGLKSAYQALSTDLFDELRKYEREQFDDWVSNTTHALEESGGTMGINQSGRLMELDFQSGKLVVNYGDHLVGLLREVRQLIALGFPVPAQIQQAADHAQRFYRHGVILKQVAHFYNTIDQQMLPSQQSMLLQPALSFERLIKDPKGLGTGATNATGAASGPSRQGAITWDSPQELETYIAKLQAAADLLTSENRKFRRYHNIVEDHVITLMGIDLVKNQSRWKEILNQTRAILNTVQEGGVKPEHTLTWRNHWDYQLYKALEHQYQVGLESLNESLAEIKVDLVFKQQRLQFRPPYEEIRAKYYRELKKFINLPSAFKGLGETRIFSLLVDQNASSLATVYNKAETLFQNLLQVYDIFKDWVMLGTVDLDTFVQDALGDASDWEMNFRVLKQKGKDAEQLPSMVKIDCITVSTVPVKATIDDHLQRLFDALLTALRKAVTTHLAGIEDFVGKGMDILMKRPQTMAEIGEANTRHEELSKSKLSIQSHFEAAESKNKLLKSVAGSGIDMSAVQAKWSKLELMLESHELMVKEQVDMLRGAIEGRTQLFLAELEKFTLRWQQLKPKPTELGKLETALKAVGFVKERLAEFVELEKSAAQIIVDSGHFGVAPPDFAELDIAREDLQNADEMWAVCEQYIQGLGALRSQDWISFRAKPYQFDEFIAQWNERIRGRQMDAISSQLLRDLDSYRGVAPNIKFLRGDNWMSEHWGELFRIMVVPRGIGISELTFGHILDLRDAITSRIEEIKELNSRANGEVAIREAIQELDIWAAGTTFSLTDYEDAKGGRLQLIKEWKETLTQVGDNQSLLSSLKDSPYFKNFADKAHSWEVKLAELDEYLRQLNTVQRRWVYLEPIFSRGALPSEQSRFARIDEDFRGIVASIMRDARIVSIVSYPGIRGILSALVDQLERCQKALNEFLEQKRAKFARFYFIGDEDLLEILGQAKNPQVIQAHLKKLFAGVHNVQFDDNMTKIVAMRSLHGEQVVLKSPVQVTDEVETWLQDFALEMKATLKALLDECLVMTDIFKYPSQLIGLAEYLHFTSNVEQVIQTGSGIEGFERLEKELRADLDKYTSFATATIADKVERTVVELKIKSLILDIIHFIDVVGQLKAANPSSLTDWVWRRQLRFNLNDDKVCIITMNDAKFEYTYEYVGNCPKLVHTPLTDKCYLTLTQAMASGFGGNPFGPAGTGKTESVKALGVLFGRQVLVFNCDEGIDYKSMGRIFVGLVKCGAWGCFDEFNRLEEAVLSAVSQQIQVIQAALKRKESSGYGGRQKLPDNLKQLFRSVAMTHPNNELISEVILFSEGFHRGKELGRKVVSIFTLCKQFLTPQQHYDWGLRPLKAVLGLAGSLLHEEKRAGPVNDAKEASRFNMLINDLFPSVEIQEISYDELQKALVDAYQELNLIYIESQAEKVFQMYEACRQRMGVVLVGPSGSGKSTIWRLLQHAWQKTGQRLALHKTNPKAVDRQSLLGHMDIDTREWSDGILTYASRQAVKESLDVHTWILCDGDVDPEWVESLNSVLDDNRLLTMPNGERIQFGPNINFVFETHNLSFASPATVSRMGMIYLSDETLDVKILVNSWIAKQSEKLRASLGEWIGSYFYRSIDWIKQNSEMVVETTRAGIVMNGLSQIGGASTKTQFLYGLIRGLGSNLFLEQRLAFANELLQWAGEQTPDAKRTLDYCVSANGALEMYKLREPASMEGVSIVEDMDRMPVIETPDLQRSVDMIMPWLNDSHPFLLVGPEGAGKFTLLRHGFSKLKSTTVAIIHCSAQTKSSHVLHRLTQTCVASTTVKGRVLRPKDAEKLILYLKDINLPKPDKYETVELVQFLQQLLTYKGFFDAGLEWVSIENIQIVASMNPSTTIGRHKLSTRFTSTIRVGYIAYTDREQLQSIYRILLRPVIEGCLPAHRIWSLPKNISKLAATIVNVFEQTVLKFTVDMYSHYLFTPRDVTRLVVSLGRFVYTGTEDMELIDVIAYECQRLFLDRLVGSDARQKFQTLLLSVLRSEWSYQGSLSGVVFATAEPGTSVSVTDSKSAKAMVRLPLDKYKERVAKQLQVYERDIRDLHLSLFPETLDLMARVEQVLGQTGGSLLLAGRPGIPFTSVVHLAAACLGYKLISPKVSRSYSFKAFTADLKLVLQTAGISGEDVVFLVEDYQLVEASFLESINSLLSGAEVSGVYPQDELDALLGSLKDSHSEAGFRGSLYEYFVSRVRKHLHVVLILDSAASQFTANCESNPALYTRCQMQWMDAWSQESMRQLAREAFERSETLQAVADKDALINELLAIHQSCVSRGGTSKHFFEYLGVYEKVYRTKLDTLQSKQSYLEGGLKKLNEAAKYVDRLSGDAKRQQAELTEKQRQADVALKQITDSMVQASEQKKEMETLTKSLKEEEAKMIVRKQAVEKELAEVDPILRAAKAAVGEIRPESLSEIRSLRAPPPAIRDVLEGVLRLMGVLDMSWNSMKGFLGQRSIKDEIINFDAHSISKQTRDAVQELIRQKKDSFEDATIRRVSVAAAPLAVWVKANLQYATVVEKVAPLEQDLQRLTSTLEASRARVQKLKEQLDHVDRKVADLKADFGEKTREAESLKASLDKAMSVIHRAQGLLEKLSGEGGRWKSQVDSIRASVKTLPRNGLLAAAFIVYLAGAPEDVRKAMTVQWSQLTNIRDFNFVKVMSTESEQLVWKSQGLPSDALSIENAIIAINSRTISLMIDPSGQATEWVKRYLKDHKPETINQSDDNFIRALELAVRFGKTLVVQEVTQIEAVLVPLLRGDLQKQGPRYVVELGDKTIDYNEDFRLYLVTRRSAFVVPPDSVGTVNDINFTITRAGLAGQLLGVTLKHERPELEVQKMTLLKNEDDLKLQLSTLEDKLLRELANSEGNILENASLINSLNETKEKSNIIATSLNESQRLQASLDAECDKFAPISVFGSALFFVVSDMQKINNMYRFSLSAFLRLFEEALKTEATSNQDGTELRIKLLMSCLEKITFQYISRSLLKADRQMFALHMIHELHQTLFEPREWELFAGQIVLADADDKASDTPEWVPDERKAYFRQLQATLPNLFQSLGFSDKDAWTDWIRSPNCEATFPRDKISPFQRVLVVQALRPDRLLTAMAAFSCADPSQDLKELAAQEIGMDKFHQVSMGQGQGELAISLLRQAAESGGWVYLQNIHLVIGWVPVLEKELLSIKLHPKFRLWLTSEPHAKFPPSLLENCLKITVEAPPGVKKNLQRIYETWTPEFIQQGSVLRAQALFALAWFHAVIQERRTYIPQGWNKFYEFSAADLRSSAELISTMCDDNQAPQWAILHGLMEDAIYGGRIDDHQDALKLRSYLAQFFCDGKYVFTVDGKGPVRRICKSFALPRTHEHAAYRQIVAELPENDNVALFGLPANIDRTLQRLTSQAVIGQLKILRQSDVQSHRFDKEKWSQELLPFLQLWKKLNTGIDLLQKKVTVQADADPIPAFFDLELLAALNLIRRIHADLASISKLLRGMVLLSNDIQQVGTALMRGETPAIWMSMWEGPESAQSYMREVISKGVSVQSLRDKAAAGASGGVVFKDPIALSSLLNPVTFLNAQRQQTSRKLKQPMDSLRLLSTWNPSELKDCPLKVSVNGVLLQGCNFNGDRLSEAGTNDPIFTVVPTCHMGWVSEVSIKSTGKLEVPLYINPTREKMVTSLMVPCQDDGATWIQAGVSFFLSAE
ncbi:dynein heavy chain and region D6 of dynein motor-domain-containing protein [Entophlyctis helioformis]|nr:dynein heavy chain and region D6 of dynein motor-domain-containing protein [Entophlyctis helioformis]